MLPHTGIHGKGGCQNSQRAFWPHLRKCYQEKSRQNRTQIPQCDNNQPGQSRPCLTAELRGTKGSLSSPRHLYLGGGGREQLPPLLAMVLQTPLSLLCPAGLPRNWPAQKALPILGPRHWVLSLGSLEDKKQAVKSLFQAVW